MWRGVGDGWSALSMMVAGMFVWGAIGFGLDRLLGTWPVLFVIGVILGKLGAAYLVYSRFGGREEEVGSHAP
jgi:ATP synthase protein I